MLDGSQGAGSVGASQASISNKKHKASKRNAQSIKNTEASGSGAYVNESSPVINHQDQLEGKKASVDKARNDSTSQGGSQVRVQRKPLH